jgi:hypothetical protein
MAQRIIVQDGNIVLSMSGVADTFSPQPANPSIGVNFSVNGQANIAGDLNVGTPASLLPGIITTPTGLDLQISAGTNGHLKLSSSGTGNVSINGSVWPSGFGSSGFVLTTDGAGTLSWVAPGGGGSTVPGGVTANLQYNNAGAFGAIADGTIGQILMAQGSGVPPIWVTPASPSISSITLVQTQSVDGSTTSTANWYVDSGAGPMPTPLPYSYSYPTDSSYIFSALDSQRNTTTDQCVLVLAVDTTGALFYPLSVSGTDLTTLQYTVSYGGLVGGNPNNVYVWITNTNTGDATNSQDSIQINISGAIFTIILDDFES